MYSDRMRRIRPSGLFTKRFIFVGQGRRWEFAFTHDEVIFPSVPGFVVVVYGFPKSDPDIKQSQTAAQTPNKTIGDKTS